MSAEKSATPPQKRVFSPAVDIEESQREIIVWADMPGVHEGDVRVSLDKNVLSIEASVTPSEFSAHELSHREYHEGSFRRVFTISDAIDDDKIRATLKDGVLRLVLPKTEPVMPRSIPVNA